MIAAQAGVAAFGQAAISWLEDQTLNYPEHLSRSFRELRDLAAS